MAAMGGAGAGAPNIISIPSQHIGNCASDTLQSILFFADGYKETLAKIVANNNLPPPDLTKSNETLSAYIYILRAIMRNRKLGKTEFIGPTLLQRRKSESSFGTYCSANIGAFFDKPLTPDAWTFNPEYYTFTERILQLIREFAHPSEFRFSISNDLSSFENLNAMQFMTFTEPFFQDKHSSGEFHTFCILKYNDKWFIADNMLGFLVPIADGIITRETVTSYQIFVMDDKRQRSYIWYQGDVGKKTIPKQIGIASATRITDEIPTSITPHFEPSNDFLITKSVNYHYAKRIYYYSTAGAKGGSVRKQRRTRKRN